MHFFFFFCENSKWLNVFLKKAPLLILDKVLNTPLFILGIVQNANALSVNRALHAKHYSSFFPVWLMGLQYRRILSSEQKHKLRLTTHTLHKNALTNWL